MTAADPSPPSVAAASQERRIPLNHDDESPSPDPPPLPTQPPPDVVSSSTVRIRSNADGERVDLPIETGVLMVDAKEDSSPHYPSPVKSLNCDSQGTSSEENVMKIIPDIFGAGGSKSGEVDEERSEDDQHPGEYSLKWIKWKGAKTPIITQNENGPCPLIAIMNVLILKGKLKLPAMVEIVTASQLMEYLGDFLLNSVPSNMSEGAQLNYEQNMMDAISILPKLQTGLDVNVRFTSISDFEYTPELIVFDLLQIPLYHGWLLDPESLETASAVGSCSYNQLVDKIINNKSSPKPELVTEALLAEEFLNTTATQLTYHGLLELIELVKEDEPSILFRNNHFITLYKHKKLLFQLLTDQGFLNEGSVVWETLENIEGDGEFVDSDFVPVPPRPVECMMTPADRQAQEDSDYLLALTLQEEDKKNVDKYKEWEQFKAETGMEGLTDEQLAKRLQEEEDGRLSAGTENHHPSSSNISGCRIRHVSGSGKTASIHPSDAHVQGSHSGESKPSSGSKVSNSPSSQPSTRHHHHHHPSRSHHPHPEETRPRLAPDSQRPSSSSQLRSHSPTRTRGTGSPQGGKRGDRHSESTGGGGGGGAGRDSRSSGKKSCIIQ